ncbi:MAG: ATP-binding protein [Verrucomicrobiota bacterium]
MAATPRDFHFWHDSPPNSLVAEKTLSNGANFWGDVPMAGAILDRFLRHAQTIAITGRSYRLKDHATIVGKEVKNKKSKSKSNNPGCAGGFAEA